MAEIYGTKNSRQNKIVEAYATVKGVHRNVTEAYVTVEGSWKKTFEGQAASAVISPVLEENSWQLIASVSKDGKARDYWKLGDEKSFTLIGGGELTAVICDFDKDELEQGGRAGISFGIKELMPGSAVAMNDTNSNLGGYAASLLAKHVQETVLPDFPQELRAVITAVRKYMGSGGTSPELTSARLELFPPSEEELSGNMLYSMNGEGSRYAFYETGGKAANTQRDISTVRSYWTRSAVSGSGSQFAGISTVNITTSAAATAKKYLNLMFCV